MRALDCVAFTICINYADYLAKCLRNKQHFSRWIIITASSDESTIQICRDNGIEYYCATDIVVGYGGHKFNARYGKNVLYNLALHELDIKHSWIVALDADVLLPENFSASIHLEKLSKRYLYGLVGRRIARSYWEYQLLRQQVRWDALFEWSGGILGFFCLFHQGGPVGEFPVSTDPGEHYHDDMALQLSFKPSALRVIPQVALHLGLKEVNWSQRTSALFQGESDSLLYLDTNWEHLVGKFKSNTVCVIFGSQNPFLVKQLKAEYNSVVIIEYWPKKLTAPFAHGSRASEEEAPEREIEYIDFDEDWYTRLPDLGGFDVFIAQEIDEALAGLLHSGFMRRAEQIGHIFGLYWNRAFFTKSTNGICRLCSTVDYVAADSTWVSFTRLNSRILSNNVTQTVYVICVSFDDYEETVRLLLSQFFGMWSHVTLCLCDFSQHFTSVVLDELGVTMEFFSIETAIPSAMDNEFEDYFWKCVLHVANYFGKSDDLIVSATSLASLSDGVVQMESDIGTYMLVVDREGCPIGIRLVSDCSIHRMDGTLSRQHALNGSESFYSPWGVSCPPHRLKWRPFACVPTNAVLFLDAHCDAIPRNMDSWWSWGIEFSNIAEVIFWHGDELYQVRTQYLGLDLFANVGPMERVRFTSQDFAKNFILIILPLSGMPTLKARWCVDFSLAAEELLVLGRGELAQAPICMKGSGALELLKALQAGRATGKAIEVVESQLQEGKLQAVYSDSDEWVRGNVS